MSRLDVISLSVPREEPRIVEQVSFDGSEGQVLGVIGPNGSGKSTLLRAICGLGESFDGEVKIDGHFLAGLSSRERAAKIAYVGDDCTSEFPLTAEEAVLIGGYAFGVRRASAETLQHVHECMKRSGCFEVRERQLEVLSGGERQRVALARALFQGAKILCLDESFSKLDVHHQVRMGELLRALAKQGYLLILVSHDLNFTARFADRCLLIRQGRRVAWGSTPEVLTETNLRTLYPDAKVEIEKRDGALRIYFTSSGE